MTLGELRTASKLLNAALERYHTACLAIANCYDIDHGNSLKGISQTISDAIPSELELVISYEAKIQQIKATVSQTRNIIPSIAPISLLPADILTYIFQLVLNDKPCYLPSGYNEYLPSLVKYPETLSHVCSRWRHVAIYSHVLWSHIDLKLIPSGSRTDYPASSRLLARAKTFGARTAHAPLDIHIRDADHFFHYEVDAELNAFCASIATRIRSLEFCARGSFQDIHLEALRNCFENCMPGTLYQLVITTSKGMFDSPGASAVIHTSAINLPQQHLEDLLLPVKVLRLSGVKLRWTSQVYQGLVELHLTHSRGRSPLGDLFIAHSDLGRVLAASPGLRIFHFGLLITELPPHNDQSSSVNLRYLEVVELHPKSLDQYSVLLQLLSPGSNPLRLSLAFSSEATQLSEDEYSDNVLPGGLFTDEFFSRSMFAELRVCFNGSGGLTYTPLLRLLRSLPLQRLEVLFLSKFRFSERSPVDSDSQPPSPIDLNEPEHPLACTQLHTLHLSGCSIELEDFERAARVISIQVLKVTDCFVSRQDNVCRKHEAESELARIVPTVKFE